MRNWSHWSSCPHLVGILRAMASETLISSFYSYSSGSPHQHEDGEKRICTVRERARRNPNSASHAVHVFQQHPSAGRRVLHLRRALSSPPTNGSSTIPMSFLLTRLTLLLILAHSVPKSKSGLALSPKTTRMMHDTAERHRPLTDDLDAQLLSSPSSLNLPIIFGT